MKLKRNEYALMENGMWAYHTDCRPEDVDGNPAFFDNIVNDVIDPEKYVSSPLASGVGMQFVLFLGDIKKFYRVAYFRVDGVHTTVSESGIRNHALLWSRTSDWATVDVQAKVADRLTEPKEERRGRPRKEESQPGA